MWTALQFLYLLWEIRRCKKMFVVTQPGQFKTLDGDNWAAGLIRHQAGVWDKELQCPLQAIDQYSGYFGPAKMRIMHAADSPTAPYRKLLEWAAQV